MPVTASVFWTGQFQGIGTGRQQGNTVACDALRRGLHASLWLDRLLVDGKLFVQGAKRPRHQRSKVAGQGYSAAPVQDGAREPCQILRRSVVTVDHRPSTLYLQKSLNRSGASSA